MGVAEVDARTFRFAKDCWEQMLESGWNLPPEPGKILLSHNPRPEVLAVSMRVWRVRRPAFGPEEVLWAVVEEQSEVEGVLLPPMLPGYSEALERRAVEKGCWIPADR